MPVLAAAATKGGAPLAGVAGGGGAASPSCGVLPEAAWGPGACREAPGAGPPPLGCGGCGPPSGAASEPLAGCTRPADAEPLLGVTGGATYLPPTGSPEPVPSLPPSSTRTLTATRETDTPWDAGDPVASGASRCWDSLEPGLQQQQQHPHHLAHCGGWEGEGGSVHNPSTRTHTHVQTGEGRARRGSKPGCTYLKLGSDRKDDHGPQATGGHQCTHQASLCSSLVMNHRRGLCAPPTFTPTSPSPWLAAQADKQTVTARACAFPQILQILLEFTAGFTVCCAVYGQCMGDH